MPREGELEEYQRRAYEAQADSAKQAAKYQLAHQIMGEATRIIASICMPVVSLWRE